MIIELTIMTKNLIFPLNIINKLKIKKVKIILIGKCYFIYSF